jgi:hypothetical protein
VSVDAKWSKDHVSVIGAYTLLYFRYYYWIKWTPDGTIRGISGILRREGLGECCGYFEVSMLYPSPVSVKDQGVDTREQVLNVPIACWCLWAQ